MTSENDYRIVTTPQRSSARIGEYLDLVKRRWKTVVLITMIGFAASVVYVLISPQLFVSSGTLMPPEKGSDGGLNFTSLIQGGGLDLANIGGGGGSGKIFAEILRSRTLSDSLIRRLDLRARLDLPPDPIMALQAVQGMIGVDVRQSGVIEVQVGVETDPLPSDQEIDEARMLSSEMVNEVMLLLDILNREKNVTSARTSREFLGRMVKVKREELNEALDRMATFQKANKAFSLDSQLEASVGALAAIQAKIQALEIQLTGMRQELGPNALEIERIEAQLAELRSQQSGMSGRDVLGLSLQNAPQIAKEYARLKLDIEVSTQVYALLESQYNSEQVREAGDLPTVSVLDEARPPLVRAAPRRTFTVLMWSAISGFLGLFIALLLELYGREIRQYREQKKGVSREALSAAEIYGEDSTDESRSR